MNGETNRIRLLIADCDASFTGHVSHFLSSFEDIEVISIETSGASALSAIRSVQPDVVLFDLVLPGLDGISMIRSVRALRNAPATIACTRFYSNVAVDALRELGVSYLLFKPVDVHALHAVIVSCTELYRSMQRLARASAEMADPRQRSAEVRNYLVSVGIMPKMIGCSYLCEAIRLAKADPGLMRNMSKGLYLEIARSMDSTASRIERCIRNAIDAAYSHGELRSRMENRPTNREFINYILRNLPSND